MNSRQIQIADFADVISGTSGNRQTADDVKARLPLCGVVRGFHKFSGTEMPENIVAALVPGAVINISYESETGNIWIVMPDAAAGWFRVQQQTAATDGKTAQITYEQIAAVCGDDVSTWGARMQFESDGAWKVYAVTVGQSK